MKRISKVISSLCAAILAATSVISFTGSAAKTLRDANGDGVIDIADAVDTRYYLLGKYNPTNVKSYDFDGNGIISEADVEKIQAYKIGLLNETNLPGSSTEVTQAVATTRSYYRHDCSSSNAFNRTSYSLTVNPNDNTFSNNGNINPCTIIPPNNMIRDYDTSVVQLDISNKYSKAYGSEFIVGDHLIATAAHCVYENGIFDDITINIIDSNNINVAKITPSYIHVPINYTSGNSGYDYALLYVEEDLSKYGMFQMGVALDEYVNKNGSVVASGFPGEYSDNYTGSYGVRFKSQGNIDSSNQYKLYYDADTFGGNSGGPVYVEEGFKVGDNTYDYKTVVAIHTNGFDEDANPNGKNSGTKITPDILSFYYNNSHITE